MIYCLDHSFGYHLNVGYILQSNWGEGGQGGLCWFEHSFWIIFGSICPNMSVRFELVHHRRWLRWPLCGPLRGSRHMRTVKGSGCTMWLTYSNGRRWRWGIENTSRGGGWAFVCWCQYLENLSSVKVSARGKILRKYMGYGTTFVGFIKERTIIIGFQYSFLYYYRIHKRITVPFNNRLSIFHNTIPLNIPCWTKAEKPTFCVCDGGTLISIEKVVNKKISKKLTLPTTKCVIWHTYKFKRIYKKTPKAKTSYSPFKKCMVRVLQDWPGRPHW